MALLSDIVLLVTPLQGFVLGVFGWLVASTMSLGARAKRVVSLGGAFGNVGDFGIPLLNLAFPTEYTVHQSFIAATTAVFFVPL